MPSYSTPYLSSSTLLRCNRNPGRLSGGLEPATGKSIFRPLLHLWPKPENLKFQRRILSRRTIIDALTSAELEHCPSVGSNGTYQSTRGRARSSHDAIAVPRSRVSPPPSRYLPSPMHRHVLSSNNNLQLEQARWQDHCRSSVRQVSKALLVGGCMHAGPGEIAPEEDLPKNRRFCIDIHHHTFIRRTRGCFGATHSCYH
jgi:hypothetical protein